MGAITGEEGYDTDSSSSNKVEGSVTNTMRRPPSVDDLFAPMWSLNVHANASDSRLSSSSSGARHSSADPTPHYPNDSWAGDTSRAAPVTQFAAPNVRAVFGSGQPRAPSNQGERTRPLHSALGYSSGSTTHADDVQRLRTEGKAQSFSECSELTGNDKGSETAGAAQGGSASRSSCETDGVDAKPSLFSLESEPCTALPTGARTMSGVSTATKSNSGGGAEASVLPPSQSTSDDDQVNGNVDERKAKRMLSNRESARRSRLRKQQHLDELRSQVAHLRSQNTEMHAKFSIATQRFSQLTGENHVLRTHAVDLTQKLRELYHTLSTQHPSGLHALGIQTGHLDPDPIGSFSSSHLSPYSQPLIPDLLPLR